MNEAFFVGTVWAAFAAAALSNRYSSHQRRLRAWRAAAQVCGLEDVRESTFMGVPNGLAGHKDGLDVQIGSYRQGKHTRGTRVTISAIDGVAELGLKVEGMGARILMKTLGAGEVEVGDPEFDEQFLVQGPPALALAVLNAPTRKAVAAAMGGVTTVAGAPAGTELETNAELSHGRLRVDVPDPSGGGIEERLPGTLRTLLDLAERLAGPVNVQRRLARNTGRDPLWTVRLANLKALHREYPGHAETAPALQGGCTDDSDEVRLYAAAALGPDGRDTLLELAFGSAPDDLAARAIAALGEQVPVSRALQALSDALAARRSETALACVEALGRASPGPEPAAAEPCLFMALVHEESRVRLAAARTLGRLGAASAVLPLQEAAERFGGTLRAAARQAVAEIQSRLSGATPGQLSIAVPDAGQLSLAETEGGEVSLPDD